MGDQLSVMWNFGFLQPGALSDWQIAIYSEDTFQKAHLKRGRHYPKEFDNKVGEDPRNDHPSFFEHGPYCNLRHLLRHHHQDLS